MKEPCVICRGARVIRLPVHRSVSVADFNASADSMLSASIKETSREYPCPECAPTVTKDRVAVLEVNFQADARFEDNEDYRRYIVSQAAYELAHKLAETGYVRMEQAPADNEMMRPYRFTLGVVAPKVVADLDAQRIEAENKFAASVLEIAKANIQNWGSYYGHAGLSKTAAHELIDSAFKQAKGQRPRLPDFAR